MRRVAQTVAAGAARPKPAGMATKLFRLSLLVIATAGLVASVVWPIGAHSQSGAPAALYVANQGSESITIYSLGSGGNVSPIGTIIGSNTELNNPVAMAVD